MNTIPQEQFKPQIQQKYEYNCNVDLIKDIFAYGVLLYRLGFDSAVESQTIFVEMINESGFRTISGKHFTKQSFRQMMKRNVAGTDIMQQLQTEFGDILHNINSLHFKEEAITESIYA